jgi:oligopeptide/dipeptide ABC transporter ATP-binding protein
LVSRDRDVVLAVDGVSFELAEGEALGLVGESGSGKTTLGRMVAMLEEPTAGTIRLGGRDLAQASRRQRKHLRRDVQMIFQNPYESIDPRFTIGAWVSEPLNFLGVGKASERRTQVKEMLDAVGLRPASAYIDRLPHELSGGQRQRIDIARALVVEPKLLVADEPVSMLDVSVRSGILKLLFNLREEFGVAFIFISHDLAVARYVSDRIGVMYLGKIVELGSTDPVVHQPAHPYTKMLLAAVPEPNPDVKRERLHRRGEAAAIRDIPSGCRFHTRCPLAKPQCVEKEPQLYRISEGRWVACYFNSDVLEMDKLPTTPSPYQTRPSKNDD